MIRTEAPAPRRPAVLALAGFGLLALAVGVAAGPETAMAGAGVFVLTAVLALREEATPVLTWPNAVAAFVLLMWLFPAKGYRLPVTLPFNLEPYRLFLAGLLFAFLLWLLGGKGTVGTLRFGGVVAALAAGATASAIINFESIGGVSGGSGALKALSYFVGFLVVFLLVASTITTHDAIDRIVRFFVVGATVVAAVAVYESRTGYNPFNSLHEWIPGLIREDRTTFESRAGSVRVFASSQHPIALSAALFMALPLAFYLVGRARTVGSARLWMGASAVCAMGAVATISRTTVVMAVAMLLAALWLRARQVVRFWPLLLLLPVVIHFAVPGALGGIYKAFFPQEGLTADLTTRSGESGSGRFADIGPGLRLWSEAPLFGKGVGVQLTTGEAGAAQTAANAEGATLIFDNQWLNTLVTTGAVGLAATLLFVWGSFGVIAAYARRAVGPRADLAVACAASIAAFGVSMAVFDAFAFVQATMLFFVIAALGLRIRLGPSPGPG